MPLTLNRGWWIAGAGNDPYWDNVQAITEFNSTPFTYTNSSTTSGTLTGSTSSQDTTNTMFSSAGSYDSGDPQYLYDAGQTIGLWGTGPWTIECFARPTGSAGVILGAIDWHASGSASNLDGYALYAHNDTFGLEIREGLNQTNWTILDPFSQSTWYYLAVASSGTAASGTATLSCYVALASATTASRTINSSYTYTLPSSDPDIYQCWGVYKGGSYGYQDFFEGQIDACRLTKGADRFSNASSISVPKSEYPLQ